MVEPGDKVRLIANPGRVGMVGNEGDGSPARRRVLVQFLDGLEEFVLAASLEKVEHASVGPYERIRNGRFGRASDLRGLITHFRLSGKLANLIYSLNTTNTEFLAYQFKPVLQYLETTNRGMLIADEVGLGKTIEAGLIWTELRAREDARRLLVVCPAMLCEKWQLELRSRFGVAAEIVNAGDLLKRLHEADRDRHASFALVASLQGLRPPADAAGTPDDSQRTQRASAQLAKFLEAAAIKEPLFDLTIVDEAHYLRNPETRTHALGELLRATSMGMLMLSATPIQLGSSDLFSLVNLLDAEGFPFERSFTQLLQWNAPLVQLRDKVLSRRMSRAQFVNALEEVAEAPLLQESRQVQYLRDNPPSDEDLATTSRRSELADQLDRVNPLSKIVTRTLKREVMENRVERNVSVIRVPMAAVEQQFYAEVTERVRAYCTGREISEGFMLTIPQRQMSSCMAAAGYAWSGKARDSQFDETAYEAFGDADAATQKPKTLGPLLQQLAGIMRDSEGIDGLEAVDTKFTTLLAHLERYWDRNQGSKVILFSFYRGTLSYLERRLADRGHTCFKLHGGDDKQGIINAFGNFPGPAILLSSEVASEGVDLQFSSLLINYDLPWNPARIEQRIGRIDRIGQKQPKILIWNFVHSDTLDERIYDRLLARLDIFKQALGSMEDVLGREIRALAYSLLSHRLSARDEEKRMAQTELAIANRERQQQQLEQEATSLIAHGSLIQDKVRAARELGRFIRGVDLKHYVTDFFEREFPGSRFVQAADDPLAYNVSLSTDARSALDAFIAANRSLGTTRMLQPGEARVRFDNTTGLSPLGEERIAQTHPVLKFITEQVRLTGAGLGYETVSATELAGGVDTAVPAGTYAYAIARWSLTGARTMERLEFSASDLVSGQRLAPDDAERMINAAALSGQDWLSTHNELDHPRAAEAYETLQDELDERFRRFCDAAEMENLDRIDQMTKSLQAHLRREHDKFAQRIADYQSSGDKDRIRLIPAERGRLRRVEARFLERVAQLDLRRKLDKQSSFVSAGIIHVT